MSFYGLGTKPLLEKLSEQVPQFKQVWLADNAFGSRTLKEFKDWWDIIISEVQKSKYVNKSKYVHIKGQFTTSNSKTSFSE